MRLVKLAVEAYQAIERASIEFGPGLNILYGPNDLGKSTLAGALRSVLLVPPSSSVASDFVSWYVDATPHVELTFVDDDKRYWSLQKRFGSSAADAATLSSSKDGTSFTLDCRGRQVEESIRAALGWGIPSPGGKGAPKGLPSSFLANVLLGPQTDVHAILSSSLAEDDGGGKLRLTKAIVTAFAQNDVFKKVLEAAQKEVNSYFTANGRPKKTQASKFTTAGNRVRQLKKQLTELEADLSESIAVETLIIGLRERFAQSLHTVTLANEKLEAFCLRAAAAKASNAARLAVDVARASLADVDSQAKRVADLASELTAFKGRVAESESACRRATVDLDAAHLALQAAEEAHRIATSDGAEQARELRRAQCAERMAGAGQQRQTIEGRRDQVQAVRGARVAVEQAAQAIAQAQLEQERASREHMAAQKECETFERQHAEWVATGAYARWRAAVDVATELERVTQQAGSCLADADMKDAEAVSHDSGAHERVARVSARISLLPTSDQLNALVRLEQDLQLAEASLGGGLSIEVKGRAGLAGRVSVDEQPAREVSIDVEQRIEAERRFLLSIDDLVQIEVRAGAADKRRTAEALRARRVAEVLPVLQRAGVASLVEIASEATSLAGEQRAIDQDRERARSLRATAQSLRDRAADHCAQAERLRARGDELASRRAALGNLDLAVLKGRFDSLGAGAESKIEAAVAQSSALLGTARDALAAREKPVALAEFRLTEASDRQNSQQAAYLKALATLATDDPDSLLASVEADLAAILAEEAAYGAELQALAAEATTKVANSTSAVAAARERVRTVRQESERLSAVAEADRQKQATKHGELSTLRSQLDSFNRTELAAHLRQRETELAAFGADLDLAIDALQMANQEVERAHRDHEQSKQELYQAEGKLSNAGGAALRDNVDRLREAHQQASEDEGEVEIEADAWQLLHDTMRAVENDEGAHLGRALTGPLTARFRDLTENRYSTLLLNPLLKVEAVSAAMTQTTGSDVLAALSVGTRDQLATLIRLTIAEELGSAIVLDDHLVHSDPTRLAWFRQALSKAALKAQVIVLTCRPQDYLTDAEIPESGPHLDLAGGSIRAIDLAHVLTRYQGRPPQSSSVNSMDPIERARAS